MQNPDLTETNFIGTTCFIDENGKKLDFIDKEEKILIVNFPGSGMSFSSKNTEEIINKARQANLATKDLILEGHPQLNLDNCSFLTAVYENKADKAVKEYNDNGTIHSQAIFDQLVFPLITKNPDQTFNNLRRLIFRGHCFGGMVISELETLLKNKLCQQRFSQEQIKKILSAPKAFLSSPALQLDKYPQHFQTTAIVNNSDRTITGTDYCGEKLKTDIQKLTDFKEEDLIFLKARRIAELQFIPKLPPLKTHDIDQGNLHLRVCNHTFAFENYQELEKDVKNHITSKKQDATNKETFIKYLKKKLNGHEFNLLPDSLRQYFANHLTNAILTEQNSKTPFISKNTLNIYFHR